MGLHYWLFPWLAIGAGAVSLAAALTAGRQSFLEIPASKTPRGFLFVWLMVLIVGVLITKKLSAVTGAEFVTERGLVLGAFAGLVVSAICKRGADGSFWIAPALIGAATLTVAIGRMWLSFNEVNGLMSVSAGMALSLLCCCLAPALLLGNAAEGRSGAGRAVATLLYTVTMAAAVQLGFTKADMPADAYWADIPLLIGGALSLMLVVAAALARGSFAHPVRPIALVVIGALAAALAIAFQAKHEWKIAILPAVGAAVALVGMGIARSALPGATARLGSAVGVMLIVGAVIISFSFWSGYGVALLVLGLWTMAAAPVLVPRSGAASPGLVGLGFAAAVLIYRLALLQSTSAVRATGPGEIWDLFAICLGATLPTIVSEWMRLESRDLLLPRPIVLIEWLAALIAPAVVLEYVWQPRSLAGVYLGVALGLLLANRDKGDDDAKEPGAGGLDRITLSGITVSLVMFQFLPLLDHLDTPSRITRICAGLILAGLLVVRLFLPPRPREQAAAAASGAKG